jgi:ATP-binding cassette, subfamily B, bacterial
MTRRAEVRPSNVPRRFRRVGRIFARLSPLVGRRRGTLVLIAAASSAAGLAEAGVLALVAAIATAMSTGIGRSTESVGPIALNLPTSILLVAALALAVLRLLLQIVVARLPARLSGRVQSELRLQLFDAFLAASWAEKAKEKEGHLQELMGGQTSQAGNAVLLLATGLAAALMFLSLAVSAFLLSVWVAAAVMATATVLFGGLRPLTRRVRRRSAATSAASMSQATGVAESLRMAEEVQVFGAGDAERSRVEALVASVETNFVRTRSLSRIVPVVYETAVIVLLIAGLSLLYAIGTTRLATLGAVVLLLVRAASYGQQFQTAYQGLGEALPYFDRLTSVIEHYGANARPQGHRRIGSVRTIEFDSVSFSYRPGTPVLRDVSFSITAGEVIGVVGPTGAGKSTVVQLLLRLREPSTGRYRVNGLPAGEIDDEALHRKVAYLPQEPHLLAATVAENIRFYRAWVDDEAIERAARLAHIHADTMSWTDGYDTVVGQRADAVSGGQRQRLCLARALAGAPELLILDEPTSSLDVQSELLIQESLEEVRANLTLVIVAHRLTTLNLCDRVMVVRDGDLEAFAPAELLYDSNEFYRRAADLAAIGKHR